ncbi:MAG: hypothetical protein JW982_02630, partial [Spirochaetes bacterium]|nr:hypothetical protein [Spirochaetota bacterium]
FNAGSFDLGVAGIRIMHDNNHADETALENNHNKTGFFFKGDLFIGIQSSYAFHFDDEMGRYFHEADAGVDYSFFAGRLFTETLFYFNEAGETDSDKYRVVTDSVFKARYYNYSSFSIVISDFISTGMQSFVNICDYSYMLIPSFRFQPANAITLSLQGAYISGTGSQEFNRSAGGEYSIFVRTEIIF